MKTVPYLGAELGTSSMQIKPVSHCLALGYGIFKHQRLILIFFQATNF